MTRVPVEETPTSLAYVKKRAMGRAARAPVCPVAGGHRHGAHQHGRAVVGQSIADPSATLAGELRRFGLDATRREAVVVYDAALTPAGKDNVVKRRFEAHVPIGAIDAANAGPHSAMPPFGSLGEVATWVAAN